MSGMQHAVSRAGARPAGRSFRTGTEENEQAQEQEQEQEQEQQQVPRSFKMSGRPRHVHSIFRAARVKGIAANFI